jgi:hypothetical protein
VPAVNDFTGGERPRVFAQPDPADVTAFIHPGAHGRIDGDALDIDQHLTFLQVGHRALLHSPAVFGGHALGTVGECDAGVAQFIHDWWFSSGLLLQ